MNANSELTPVRCWVSCQKLGTSTCWLPNKSIVWCTGCSASKKSFFFWKLSEMYWSHLSVRLDQVLNSKQTSYQWVMKWSEGVTPMLRNTYIYTYTEGGSGGAVVLFSAFADEAKAALLPSSSHPGLIAVLLAAPTPASAETKRGCATQLLPLHAGRNSLCPYWVSTSAFFLTAEILNAVQKLLLWL